MKSQLTRLQRGVHNLRPSRDMDNRDRHLERLPSAMDCLLQTHGAPQEDGDDEAG